MHTAEGRLRVKIAGLKRSPEKASDIENNLISQDGVTEVNANPLTGNLLVLFEPESTTHEQIIGHLKQAGYLNAPQKAPKGGSGAHNGLTKSVRDMMIQMAVEAALKRLIFAII
jgi:copper chaperone CopZ